jgi:hypothetical protein
MKTTKLTTEIQLKLGRKTVILWAGIDVSQKHLSSIFKAE